jgi:hypothetical protein
MELQHDYRLFLLDLLDSYVFTDLMNDNNDYWKRSFQRRHDGEDDGATWSEIAPFTDIFKMVVISQPDKEMGTEGELRHCSVVSCSMFHWDAILSYYLMAAPEFYQTPSRLVGMLLKTMGDLKLHPSGIQNFPAAIWRWLTRVQDGSMPLTTINCPIESCWNLKWIQHMVNKYGETAVFAKDFLERPEVQADEKEIRSEVQKRFLEVLNRHPNVRQAATVEEIDASSENLNK